MKTFILTVAITLLAGCAGMQRDMQSSGDTSMGRSQAGSSDYYTEQDKLFRPWVN